MRRWFRSLRWPLRDPVIREARDDYRDAQAAIRLGLEQRIADLEGENGRLKSSLAAALAAVWMYQGTARRRRVDLDVTTEYPRAALRRNPNRGERP